jgi:menaquinone-dependent protoporphyrinogen IX oxidase
MASIAVIYKSHYGTTRQYAQWIAKALDAELFETSKMKPAQLSAYDVVVYGGGLYAGGIDGVGLVTKNPCKSLIVFTVGLADPAQTDYSAILNRNFTPELLAKTKVFHLRGGIDYRRLNFLHRGMMAMVKKMVAGKGERSEEAGPFLETYGGQVDFTDESTIQPLVSYVKEAVNL